MKEGNIDVLNESTDGWSGHCHRFQRLVYEAVIQWPDHPDYMAEGCIMVTREDQLRSRVTH